MANKSDEKSVSKYKNGVNSVKLQSSINQLAISTNLIENLNREKLVRLLKEIPSKKAIRYISKYAKLNVDLLSKLQKNLDWEFVAQNREIEWSIDIIKKFQGRFIADSWEYLFYNFSLTWGIELIETFEEEWTEGWWVNNSEWWREVSGGEILTWSDELIKRMEKRAKEKEASPYWNPWSYDDRWDSPYANSCNCALPWSSELIRRFKNHWDWFELSKNTGIPWTLELISEFSDYWCWEDLSESTEIPWSLHLIKTFEKNWDWSRLSGNTELPWSGELIEYFKDQWDWGNLSSNYEIDWGEGLVDLYQNKLSQELIFKYKPSHYSIKFIEGHRETIDWGELSTSRSIPWSIDLIRKYEKQWDWGELSINPSLPWSIELIDLFVDRWNWEGLSRNKAMPASLEILEKYIERWHWGMLSNNCLRMDELTGVSWAELLEKFERKWSWSVQNLSRNEALPWSLDFINRFNKLDFSYYFKRSRLLISLNQSDIEEIIIYHATDTSRSSKS